MHTLQKHWPLFCALIGVFLVGAGILTLPFETLLVNFLPDDAFYYFKVAEHVLGGHGSTFDGVHFTNGYHPLWLLMLLPVFAFFGNAPSLAPLYAVLTLGIMLYAATTWVLYVIIARYTQQATVKALALFVWVGNPFLWYEFLNGLETDLMLFLLSVFIWGAIHVEKNPSWRVWALLGALGGLLTLARLDAIFYPALFFSYIFFRAPRAYFVRILSAGIAFMGVVSPWFLWNMYASGMFLTSASVTSTMVNHHLTFADNGAGLLTLLKAIVYFTHQGLSLISTQTGAFALLVFVCGMGCALVLRERMYEKITWRTIPPAWIMFGGFVLMFIANASVRWSMRSWYFIAFSVFLTLALGYVFETLRVHLRAPRLFAIMFVFLFIPSVVIAWHEELREREAPARDMQAAAEWGNTWLPRGSVIGVFNSGVQSYFSVHRVVNLDGLINNSASEAMQRRELWRYIEDEKIDFIIDFDIYLAYRYRDFFGIADPFLHLKEMHRIKTEAHNRSDSGIVIYRVLPAVSSAHE